MLSQDLLESSSTKRSRRLKAVVFAWLLAGTLDISAAVICYPLASGVKVTTLLQGIASGVLGDKAFVGGLDTAALGLAYGVLVWIVMNTVVLPLSNVHHAPFNLPQAVVGAVILMFCIGLPITMIVGKYHAP